MEIPTPDEVNTKPNPREKPYNKLKKKIAKVLKRRGLSTRVSFGRPVMDMNRPHWAQLTRSQEIQLMKEFRMKGWNIVITNDYIVVREYYEEKDYVPYV